MNYYNDFDPKVCLWLEELIREEMIPAGKVDNRSIEEIKPNELKEFTQCHFFAGIGGWSRALELAGWEPEKPVWTGSCPCQPLSCAGQGKGSADERHLWPTFYKLISECNPSEIFGEQVASKLGREWFAGIRLDLEGAGYACGGANLPAASVASPHKRERLFWVASTLDNSTRGRHIEQAKQIRARGNSTVNAGGMADTISKRGCSRNRERADAEYAIPSSFAHWQRSEWVKCRDERQRRIPIEPSLHPLAHGVPGRVALMRGAGNAIVPQVAAEFIKAYLES